MRCLKYLMPCCVAVLVFSFCAMGNKAFGCGPDCGGILNVGLSKYKNWAHYDPNDPENSELIRITTSENLMDRDYDPDVDPVNCIGNFADPDATEWAASSGVCNPETGAYTDWRPSERGADFTVTATFHDEAEPENDPDVEQPTTVNSFEVYIVMTLIDNAGVSDNEVRCLYETSGTQTATFTSLPCSSTWTKWNGATANGGTPDPDNVHIQYLYKTLPGGAEPSGDIEADLSTCSSTTLTVDIEDVDLVDGSVSFSIGATIGSPVGFSFGTTVTFGSDCAEGVAAAAWGYSQTDGLGSNLDPDDYKLEKKSVDEIDPPICSEFCFLLSGALPPTLWQQSHPYSSYKSYDTGWKSIRKPKNGEAQAEWAGYASASTGGNKSGAGATACLDEWDVTAECKNVRYVAAGE